VKTCLETVYAKENDLVDKDIDEVVAFIKKNLPESKDIFINMDENLASLIKAKDLVLFADL
jgi:hypothetical protein